MIGMAFLWLLRRPLVAVSLTALIVGLPSYQAGKWSGARQERAQAELRDKQATFEQLKERIETDEEISNLDDADLCIAIGGELRDGQCL